MDSKTWRLTLRDHLSMLGSFLSEQAKTRDEYRQQHAKLANRELMRHYTQEYIQDEVNKLDKQQRQANDAGGLKAAEMLNDLFRDAQRRRDEPLDLADKNLSTALAVIRAGGQKLGGGELKGIVNGFVGNPAALRTLRSIFENLVMPWGVAEVDRFIYEPTLVEQQLRDLVLTTFQMGGSLNTFSSALNKFAEKEGQRFPLDSDSSLIDQAGADETLRRAAGLANP